LRNTNWHPKIRAVLVLILLSFAGSCATQNELPPVPAQSATSTAPPSLPIAPPTRANPSKEVRASFQGSSQAGHATASGEAYDPNDLTAASRTLPIGSSVIVTNPATGRSAKVRINDRGPYVGGRSLDLSKRAAEKIGLTDKGVARVKVKRADSKPKTPESSNSSSGDSSSPSTPKSDR
jgi:rare lipoprotein A